jgi:hypothetical protein
MDFSGEFQSIDGTGHHDVSEYHINLWLMFLE